MDHEDQFISSATAIRNQVDRIVASHAFASSERMARFLRCVVEHALAGRSGELKEYLIGVEVFDRKSDYDPRVDPIVRVEARRLRTKLASYYETEGASADVLIELPKGSYVPKVTTRSTAKIEATAAPAPPPEEPGVKRIAVLPFSNLSRNPEHDYRSDGLTEELIHALTKVPTVRVVAWNSAARIRGGELDIYRIGVQLGVSTVLMGSVRCEGDRIRILAQLVDTKTGFYLWSENYDRKVEEIFAIQQEIACSIVGALKAKLTGKPEPRQYDLRAYNEYLKGRYHWNKRSVAGMMRSLEHYDSALAIDPNFALAYVGIADANLLLSLFGVAHPAESVLTARAAALKALQIDPTLGEAEISLGMIKSIYDWDWVASEKHYLRGMELNPGYATAFHWYGLDLCGLLGRWPEAFKHLNTALELDPLSSIIREGNGYLRLLARQYDAALAEYNRLLEFDPFFYKVYSAIGRAHSLIGQYSQAIDALEEARQRCGEIPNILGALGQTYALAGKPQKAREMLDALSDLTMRRHVSATCFALVHLGLGERGCALNWLERGVVQRETSMCSLGVHPAYDDLRGEPRFHAILRRLGLGEVGTPSVL